MAPVRLTGTDYLTIWQNSIWPHNASQRISSPIHLQLFSPFAACPPILRLLHTPIAVFAPNLFTRVTRRPARYCHPPWMPLFTATENLELSCSCREGKMDRSPHYPGSLAPLITAPRNVYCFDPRSCRVPVYSPSTKLTYMQGNLISRKPVWL